MDIISMKSKLLQKKGEFWNNCANLVLRLQDSDGQFSYPGGRVVLIMMLFIF